jgi:hypothetical protein
VPELGPPLHSVPPYSERTDLLKRTMAMHRTSGYASRDHCSARADHSCARLLPVLFTGL